MHRLLRRFCIVVKKKSFRIWKKKLIREEAMWFNSSMILGKSLAPIFLSMNRIVSLHLDSIFGRVIRSCCNMLSTLPGILNSRFMLLLLLLLPLLIPLLLLPMYFLTLPGARQELGDLRAGKLQLFLALSSQYSFYYKATKLMFSATRLAPFLCQQAWIYKIQTYKSLYPSRELTAIKQVSLWTPRWKSVSPIDFFWQLAMVWRLNENFQGGRQGWFWNPKQYLKMAKCKTGHI